MISERIKKLIQEMPKGENHVHIEGSISGEVCFRLAEKKGIELPYQSVEELDRHFLTDVKDLDSFLDCYRLINELCIDETDYYETVLAIGEDAKRQNIIYRELMLDFPMTADINERFGKVIHACFDAAQKIKEKYGILMPIIVCADRTQPLELCMEYVKGFQPYLEMIDAIGLDYEEVGFPPEIHREVFELAKNMGLYRTCHVQESTQNLKNALQVLGCQRIDHGACAAWDEELMKDLADKNILLTICPTSNVITGLYSSLGQHDLKKIMSYGVKCSVNSDDPAFFGDLVTEFECCAEALDLSETDIVELNRNSFLYSIKGKHLVSEFDAWYETFKKEMGGMR